MQLFEATLESLSLVLSRIRGLESWDVFNDLIVLLCLLLDSKMSPQAGVFAEGGRKALES